MHKRQWKIHILGNELPLSIPLAQGNRFHLCLGQLSINWINFATYQGRWWSSSGKEATSWGLYYVCWFDFGVGALRLCMAMPTRQGRKTSLILQHSSCGHGTERKNFLQHLPRSSGIPQIKCESVWAKKKSRKIQLWVLWVSHRPLMSQGLVTSVQGNRKGWIKTFREIKIY